MKEQGDLIDGLYHLAQALAPSVALQGQVTNVTEAVMDANMGLVRIAEALQEVAGAIQEVAMAIRETKHATRSISGT